MNIDRIVLAFAGTMIVFSVAMSQLHSVYWLGFTVFVGLNMFQSSFTGFCPLAKILKSFGRKTGPAFG